MMDGFVGVMGGLWGLFGIVFMFVVCIAILILAVHWTVILAIRAARNVEATYKRESEPAPLIKLA
jgi:uncharacterized membrane protein